MKNTFKLTYVVLASIMLVGAVLAFSRTNNTRPSAFTPNQQDQAKWKLREEEQKKHFPIADFNEPEPTEAVEREKRKTKTEAKEWPGSR